MFSKIKGVKDYNNMNTLSISMIYPPQAGYNLSLSKQSVDPAQRGRRNWEK
jgi:hypothetical protein